jgi:hypothetical protein
MFRDVAVSWFEVERYRSFASRTRVELRPLTLLFGYNSAGKSALARALPLVAASCGGATFGPLALDAGVARRAEYDDLVCKLEAGDKIMFRVAWDEGPEDAGDIEWWTRGDEDKGHVLDSFIVRSASGAERLHLRDDLDRPEHFEVMGQPEKMSIRLAFDGLLPVPSEDSLPAQVKGVLSHSVNRIRSLQSDVHWLGAVRAEFRRGSHKATAPKNLGEDGRWTGEKLITDHVAEGPVFPFVAERVSRMFGQTLFVTSVGDMKKLTLAPDLMSPLRVSVVDVGEGVSQVLAVLTTLGMASAGQLGTAPVVVLEQPEMHLHPRAEQVLAEALCAVAATPGVRLVVETHSENLLLFVQLQIAKGLVSPDDVAILWIEAEEGRSRVEPIAVDPAGRPMGWPSGVFSEDAELARQLFLARRGR